MKLQLYPCDSLDNLINWIHSIRKFACFYFYTDDFVGDGIVDCQDLYWKEFGKKSNYSHIALLGIDGNVYESTVKLSFKDFVFGSHSTPLTERLTDWKTYKKFAVQIFDTITEEQWKKITEEAKNDLKKDKKIFYGFLELFGTLWTLIRWKMTKDKEKRKKILRESNIFNSSHCEYCISYVVNNIQKAIPGIDLLQGWNESVITVDHLWYSEVLSNEKYMIERI